MYNITSKKSCDQLFTGFKRAMSQINARCCKELMWYCIVFTNIKWKEANAYKQKLGKVNRLHAP